MQTRTVKFEVELISSWGQRPIKQDPKHKREFDDLFTITDNHLFYSWSCTRTFSTIKDLFTQINLLNFFYGKLYMYIQLCDNGLVFLNNNESYKVAR